MSQVENYSDRLNNDIFNFMIWFYQNNQKKNIGYERYSNNYDII